MSLMEKIRGGTESGAMRVVLGIIVVVFVFWGIGTGNSPTSQVVATVNGKRITDTKFHKVMKQHSRSQQGNLTEEQHKSLARDVVMQLVTQEVLLQEADDLGIEVSDEEVARTILELNAFLDETGKFSPELYTRHLKRYGTTRAGFEEDIRESLILSRLQDVAMQSIVVDEAEIRDRWFEEMTSFQLDLVTVRALSFYDDVHPTELEIETFIAENRPEIRAYYDENFETRFHKPPRALTRTIMLETSEDEDDSELLQARMDLIQQELEGGADFAMLARKYSEHLSAENGGLLGEVRYDQIDVAVANAIFGTEASPLTEPGLRSVARTERGIQLLKVEEYLPEETTEEQDARAEIAEILMKERNAPGLAAAYAEQLRSTWAGSGNAPLGLLAEQGLSVKPDGPITLANPSLSGLGIVDSLSEALREAEEGQLLDTVLEIPGAWLVVRVATRTEPDQQRLETELPLLEPRIQSMRRMEFMNAWVDDLVADAEVKQYHNF